MNFFFVFKPQEVQVRKFVFLFLFEYAESWFLVFSGKQIVKKEM